MFVGIVSSMGEADRHTVHAWHRDECIEGRRRAGGGGRRREPEQGQGRVMLMLLVRLVFRGRCVELVGRHGMLLLGGRKKGRASTADNRCVTSAMRATTVRGCPPRS